MEYLFSIVHYIRARKIIDAGVVALNKSMPHITVTSSYFNLVTFILLFRQILLQFLRIKVV